MFTFYSYLKKFQKDIHFIKFPLAKFRRWLYNRFCSKEIRNGTDNWIFLDSSMVEHTAVNRGVVGSSPTRGVFEKNRAWYVLCF